MKTMIAAIAILVSLNSFGNEVYDAPNTGKFPSKLALKLGSIDLGHNKKEAVLCAVQSNEGPSVIDTRATECVKVGGAILKALQNFDLGHDTSAKDPGVGAGG